MKAPEITRRPGRSRPLRRGWGLLALLLLVGGVATPLPAEETAGRSHYFASIEEVYLTTRDYEVDVVRGVGAIGRDRSFDLDEATLTAPKVTFGYLFASGKSRVYANYWRYRTNNNRQDIFDPVGQAQDLLGIPIYTFGTGPAGSEVPNSLIFHSSGQEIDLQMGDINFRRNLKATKRWLFEYEVGLRIAEYHQSLTVDYGYNLEREIFTFPQDLESVFAETITKGVGPRGALYTTWKLGKRWSLSGGLGVSLLRERVNVEYINVAIDTVAFDCSPPGSPFSFGFCRTGPFGVTYEDDNGLQTRLFDNGRIPVVVFSANNYSRFIQFWDANFEISFRATDYFTITAGYQAMRWNDIITPLGVIEAINGSISNIHIRKTFGPDFDPLIGDPNNAANDEIKTTYDVGPIEPREDVEFTAFLLRLIFTF